MNLEKWKEAARRNLQRLAQRIGQLAPGTVYGALCSASLLPVVTAAQQGDFAALVALGSVVGGIGGNLIANQIQGWHERSEEELAAELGQRATADPAWRDALDAVLADLQAPQVVQAALAEADRAWFADALRAELERLGNLARYEALLEGSGTIIQGSGNVGAGAYGTAIGAVDGDAVVGDDNLTVGGHLVIAQEGATVVIGEAPVKMTAVGRRTALGRYLLHVISRNRYLQLQGIRSGGKLVHIELDRIYIRLRAVQQRIVETEERWLAEEASLAPGEMHRWREQRTVSTQVMTVSVEEALAGHPRLVVLGDPGSGKTTLLRYLALLYARDLAEDTTLVRDKLELPESGWLPILLPLRQIGAFLRSHQPEDDGTEGHAVLLEFLLRSLHNERIDLPREFFDDWLNSGRAVILLDGLDEVADPDLRRRVARLLERFTEAYARCRYVVTSRIVGYTGAARLGEDYTTTTVRDFTMADVEQFLSNWHLLVAIGQMGPGPSAEAYAADQTRQLLSAIQANERIRELAINPLMLTVIAMVHRDRVKLPDRRAELYAEAVDVLLGKWEEAKGMHETPILPGKPFDTGDRRLMLQSLALQMHEEQQKEIGAEDLRRALGGMFHEILQNWREVGRAITRFLTVIEERTGLLVARGEGVYAFSHLTFQEYLAALAIAARDDYIDYTLQRTPDPWWREVVLLEVGYLSTQSKERTTRLIRAIADRQQEPAPYENLVLAAECLRDVGGSRVGGNLEIEIQRKLRADLDVDLQQAVERQRALLGRTKGLARLRGKRPLDEGEIVEEIIQRKAIATEALVRAGAGYWSLPHGEPEWIRIPAGPFVMGTRPEEIDALRSRFGGDESWYQRETSQQKIVLPDFWMARVPITNAQYHIFVQRTEHPAPPFWDENRPPKGMESHPVVNVTWHDAIAYCQWLSRVTGKHVALPSEAEWEKAARGNKDQRQFPWGDEFESTRCNSVALGLGHTTPVGIFSAGASPYGCLDMSGNVWEWTRSLYDDYPYPADGEDLLKRETLAAGDEHVRVLRGGAFLSSGGSLRGAARGWVDPVFWDDSIGFRVCASPLPLASGPL